MENSTDTSQLEAALETRLRLKRVFLRTLIVSLVTGTAIAVAVLLFGTFNQTTGRILGTLGVLALHSALAMLCADALERRWWPTLSRLGLILFGINFFCFIAVIWLTTRDEWIGREIVTTLALIGFYALAIPPAAARERGRWLAAAYAGLAACFAAFAMVLAIIWAFESENEWFARATATAAIIAAALSHTCVLGRIRLDLKFAWIVTGTLGCLWLLVSLLSYAILADDFEDFLMRLTAATGVLAGCGTLTLVILVSLKRVKKIERIESSARSIELACPRCTRRQTLPVGDARCEECALKIRIEIEEPRCAACGYLLWQLTERRCPECGRPF